MARLLLFVAFLFSTAALCSPGASATEDPLIEQVVGDGAHDELELNAEAHFASFVRRFGKTYRDDDERAHRMSVFRANLRRARRHQRLDPAAVHGVTKFSDLTPAEFRRQFLGLRRSSGRDLLKGSSAQEAPILPADGLPTDFDWRDHGAVGPVKDQGSCGSCWSFSTSGRWRGRTTSPQARLRCSASSRWSTATTKYPPQTCEYLSFINTSKIPLRSLILVLLDQNDVGSFFFNVSPSAVVSF